MTEHKFRLHGIQKGSRMFEFAAPVETISKRGAGGDCISLECETLDIIASSALEFVTIFAADYDGLACVGDEELTEDAQEKKRWLIANVTEEERTPGLRDDYWSFLYADSFTYN